MYNRLRKNVEIAWIFNVVTVVEEYGSPEKQELEYFFLPPSQIVI